MGDLVGTGPAQSKRRDDRIGLTRDDLGERLNREGLPIVPQIQRYDIRDAAWDGVLRDVLIQPFSFKMTVRIEKENNGLIADWPEISTR